jgi:hypothetical protein
MGLLRGNLFCYELLRGNRTSEGAAQVSGASIKGMPNQRADEQKSHASQTAAWRILEEMSSPCFHGKR